MTQVFISYSRKDLSFVEQLAADLQNAGLDIWFDLSGLDGGDRWGRELQNAIRQSDVFLFIVSPNSVESEWVEKEFLYASNLHKRIVPLMYQACDLPIWLLNIHYVDVQGGNYVRNFSQILRALVGDHAGTDHPLVNPKTMGRETVQPPRKDVIAKSTVLGLGALAVICVVMCIGMVLLTKGNWSKLIAPQTKQTQEYPNTKIPVSTMPVSPTNFSPASTNTPTPIPLSPTSTSTCDQAEFIADVTIPDGTQLSPNQAFTKTWRLKNIGTCLWTSNYAMVFSGGETMNSPTSQFFPGNVMPGETMDISVNLQAPTVPDHYRANWKLKNAAGVLFGVIQQPEGLFWVDIVVVEAVTPTP